MARALNERVRQALDDRDYVKAGGLLEQWRNGASAEPEADYLLGRLYGETGQVSMAVPHLERYAAVNLTCLLQAVNLLLQLHCTDAAKSILLEAMRQTPFNEQLHQLLIAYFLEQRQLAEALAAVTEKARLCGLHPQDGKLLIQLYVSLLAAGADDKLLETLMSHQQAQTVCAGISVGADAAPETVWHACEKLIRFGVYEAAQDLLNKALQRAPADPLLHRACIQLQLEQGNYVACAAAVNTKQHVCGLDDGDTPLLSKLYSLLTDAGLCGADIDTFLNQASVQQAVADNTKYAGFESLGIDCELGFVQRRLGQEPLGLLRFSGIPFDTLITLLNNDFRDFAKPENCELRIVRMADQSQYDLYDRVYRYEMHTFMVADTIGDAGAVLSKFCARVQFLKRKLLDDLASGEKIFVYKSLDCSERDVRKLSHALRRHGPNRLLVVREFDRRQERDHAALLRVDEYILNGYLEHFDVHVTQPAHLQEWRVLLDGAAREFATRPAKAGVLDLFRPSSWLRILRGRRDKVQMRRMSHVAER